MKKDRTLRIRCTRETEKAFKKFVIDSEAPSSEQALLILLDARKRLKELQPIRVAVEPVGRT